MNTYITELHSRADSSQLFTISLANTSTEIQTNLTQQFPEYEIINIRLILPGQIAIIDSETWESDSISESLSILEESSLG